MLATTPYRMLVTAVHKSTGTIATSDSTGRPEALLVHSTPLMSTHRQADSQLQLLYRGAKLTVARRVKQDLVHEQL